MGIKVTVVDNTAFLVIKKSVRNIKEGIRQGFLAVAPNVVSEVRRLIDSPPKTGRLYIINGQIHQASAPDESPATLTGDLSNSIRSSVPNFNTLIIGSGSEAPHGLWMERGTDDGRIEARPFLKPAGLSKLREVVQSVNKGVKGQLGKTLR